MAIRTEAIALDIRPCCDARGPVVCGRQGDDGTVLVATVTQVGEPMALDGLTATLKGNVPGYTETAGTVDGSSATFALGSSVFAHRGIHQLYVELSQGADVVASTQSIELRVAPGADAGAGDAEEFESFVDQMKAEYEAGIDQAEAAFDAALDAKQQEAQGLIDELDEALDTLGLPVYRVAGESAVPSKECFYSFPDADMGCDVFGYSDGSEVHRISPAWQTQRGALVQAAGCAAGVPVAGMRVFGETRQNLWSNPSGSVNGVTVSTGADGALTLSGTASATATVGLVVYVLQPGKTYTLSVDKAIPGVGDGFGFYVDTDAQAAYYVGNSEQLTAVYTTNSSATRFTVGIYIPAGTAVSGTYRVMLNEGSTAEPWCPPGLSSVGELSVVCAGKNLAALPNATKAGITLKTLEDGSLSVSGTSTGQDSVSSIDIPISPGTVVYRQIDKSTGNSSVAFQANFIRDDNTQIEWYSAYTDKRSAVAPPGTAKLRIQLYVNNAGIEVSGTFKLLVTLDPDAEWEPAAAVTETPIDLSGHQLRSLPDGTRDVLTVDGSGACEIEQATASATLDGSSDENWALSAVAANQYRFALNGSVPGVVNDTLSSDEYLCDRLPKYSGDWTGNNILINGVYQVLVTREGLTTVEGLRAWLASNPLTVVYPLATPQTVPLDPVTPPTVPAPDVTLWAASDVPCDIEATTWTASGAEQGRQQAALVKLAQQVRQQAETVAALSTQALEA